MVRSPTLSKRPRTRSLLGEGPVTPHVPGEVALSQNSWGGPDLPGSSGPPPGPGPHILSGSLSREEPIPRLGLVRGRHVSVGAGMRAGPCDFLWKTRLPTVFNTVGGAKPKAAFARLHCWSRVTKAHSAVSDTAHDAYVSLQCQLDTTARFRPL